ncbi:MAG: ATP-dependent helicase, partial [Candidatus Nanopelagicales bacterium]
GDPFQAIYGWRGAAVRNIMEFTREFSLTDVELTSHALSQNNRSAANILELANAIAAPLREAHPNVTQLHPRPDLSVPGEISLALFPTQADEVEAISDDIAQRIGRGESPSHIAVLCRETKAFPVIYSALSSRGVPVEVVGLGGLLELPEVVELVSMLLVIDDPTANPAMLRLLAGARWRIGPRDLALLGARARQLVATNESRPDEYSIAGALADAVSGIDPAEVVSLSEAVHDPGGAAFSDAARQRFAVIDAELAGLRLHRADPLPEFVQRVIDQTGLAIELDVQSVHHGEPRTSLSPRSDNLTMFCRYVGEFAELDGSATLQAFLAFLAASDRYRTGMDRPISVSAQSVKVMTIHQAKGLEWPTVYVPQLAQSVFPSSQGRPLWTSSAQVLPYPLRGDSVDFPSVHDWSGNKGCNAFREEMKLRDQLEERRLAYVAFTRAEQRLILSGHWWGPTQQKPRGPSPFLVETFEFCTTQIPEANVLRWEPPPPEGATNPALSQQDPVAWPTGFASRLAADRNVGAELVRAALSDPPHDFQTDIREHADPRLQSWDDDLQVLIAEARASNHPSREVLLPRALSASDVLRLVNDPQGMARDLARPMPRPARRAARRGTRFHTWVESRFGQAPLIDLDDLDDASTDPAADDLASLQEAFLSGPFADRAPVAVESPFQLRLGERSVRGRIDAVYATDGSLGETI